MSVERDLSTMRPPRADLVEPRQRVIVTRATREEADEARRHAAAIGDYAMAERWYWHERLLLAQDESTAQL